MPKPSIVSAAFASLLTGLLSGGAAEAEEGFYAGLLSVGSVAQTRDARNEGSLGGDTTNPNDSDLVAGLGGVLGYEWNLPSGALRSEIELHHRFRYDFDRNRPVIDNAFPNAGLDSNLASTTGLVNLTYLADLGRFDLDWPLRPYLGGGLGTTYYSAENEFNDLGGLGLISDDTTGFNFTWTAGAGLLWDLNARWHLQLGYRYIDLGTIEFGSYAGGGIEVEADYTSHDVIIGLLYRL